MTNPVDLSVIRRRFLTNWLVVRILGLTLKIQNVELIYVFYITVFLTLVSLIPKILWGYFTK